MEVVVRKKATIIAVGLGLASLIVAWFYLKIGGLMVGREDFHRRRIGYCFDVVADRAGSRLLVAAGDRGLHLFDLDRGQLRYATTYHDDGYYRNLKLWNDRAYVADSRRGLVVLDVSEETPETIWVQPNGRAGGLCLKGNLAFVAAFEDGLQVFELSDSDAPALVGSLVTPGHAWDVWVDDGFAYIADFNAGLTVVDVSTPSEPCYVETVTWADRYQSAEIVRGEGTVVYVAAADHGLVIVDVSDPLNPVVAARYRPIRIGVAEGLAVREGLVYLAVGSQIELKLPGHDLEFATTTQNGLHIVDTTAPYYPELLGKASFLGWVEGVHVAGDYAYVANTGTGVRSIDIRDPMKPALVDVWNALP
jgi:hypothetical protein